MYDSGHLDLGCPPESRLWVQAHSRKALSFRQRADAGRRRWHNGRACFQPSLVVGHIGERREVRPLRMFELATGFAAILAAKQFPL
jgi:hypothetical protein